MQDIDLLHADKEDVVFLMEKIHDDLIYCQFSDSDMCPADGHLTLFDEQARMDFSSLMRQDSKNIAKQLADHPPSLDDNAILMNYFEAPAKSHDGFIPVPLQQRCRSTKDLPPQLSSTMVTHSVTCGSSISSHASYFTCSQ